MRACACVGERESESNTGCWTKRQSVREDEGVSQGVHAFVCVCVCARARARALSVPARHTHTCTCACSGLIYHEPTATLFTARRRIVCG